MSLAAKLERELDIHADLEVGGSGQFDVLVDGALVASKERGLLSRLLGRGDFPDEAATVRAIRSKLSS